MQCDHQKSIKEQRPNGISVKYKGASSQQELRTRTLLASASHKLHARYPHSIPYNLGISSIIIRNVVYYGFRYLISQLLILLLSGLGWPVRSEFVSSY